MGQTPTGQVYVPEFGSPEPMSLEFEKCAFIPGTVAIF